MNRTPLVILTLVSFLLTGIIGPMPSYAQDLSLPAPGSMVDLSPAYMPVMIRGVKVHPDNPLLFDFILDTGNSGLKINSVEFKSESQKLIKYFLTAMTIKEDDLWVNLSPYEKDRIIPQDLGETEMGRDMLAQDYILKQLTASLIYPERDLGKKFWDNVYTKAREIYGVTDIPVDTFNKVWIVADKAKVLERNNTVFVVSSHLKVMLEEDYLSLQKHSAITSNAPLLARGVRGKGNDTRSIASQVIRAIILPELEKEVNQDKNFSPLRQMFYSMILASWYKLAIKNAFLNQVYSNKDKTSGVLSNDPNVKEKIYKQYLRAYKKGVFNYIKEDVDSVTNQPIPRKYFSGGLRLIANPAQLIQIVHDEDPAELLKIGDMAMVRTKINSEQAFLVPQLAAWVMNKIESRRLAKDPNAYYARIGRKNIEQMMNLFTSDRIKMLFSTVNYENQNRLAKFSWLYQDNRILQRLFLGSTVHFRELFWDILMDPIPIDERGKNSMGDLLDVLEQMLGNLSGVGLSKYARGGEIDLNALARARKQKVRLYVYEVASLRAIKGLITSLNLDHRLVEIAYQESDQERMYKLISEEFPKNEGFDYVPLSPQELDQGFLQYMKFEDYWSPGRDIPKGYLPYEPFKNVSSVTTDSNELRTQMGIDQDRKVIVMSCRGAFDGPNIINVIKAYDGLYRDSSHKPLLIFGLRHNNEESEIQGWLNNLSSPSNYHIAYRKQEDVVNQVDNWTTSDGKKMGSKDHDIIFLTSSGELATVMEAAGKNGVTLLGTDRNFAESVERTPIVTVSDSYGNNVFLRRMLEESRGVAVRSALTVESLKEVFLALLNHPQTAALQVAAARKVMEQYRENMSVYAIPMALMIAQHILDGSPGFVARLDNLQAEDLTNVATEMIMGVYEEEVPELEIVDDDEAMPVMPNKSPGGIDLTTDHLDLTREGNGIEMKFDPSMIAEFQKGNFTGVEGTILKIIPIESPLSVLGP